MKLPNKLKPIFWLANFNNLNFKNDSFYIIQQILPYRDFENIRRVFKNYSKKLSKDYRPAKIIFCQKYSFGIRKFLC